MSNLPQVYFGDLPADEMKEIMDAMALSQCASNHGEHRGGLWQCLECLRHFCWVESAEVGAAECCGGCFARLHAQKRVPSFA